MIDISREEWEAVEAAVKKVTLENMKDIEDESCCICSMDDGPLSDIHGYDTAIKTRCADCGLGIFHRPWMPEAVKKICATCGNERFQTLEPQENQAAASTVQKTLQQIRKNLNELN